MQFRMRAYRYRGTVAAERDGSPEGTLLRIPFETGAALPGAAVPVVNIHGTRMGIENVIRITSYNVCYTKLLRVTVAPKAPSCASPSKRALRCQVLPSQ